MGKPPPTEHARSVVKFSFELLTLVRRSQSDRPLLDSSSPPIELKATTGVNWNLSSRTVRRFSSSSRSVKIAQSSSLVNIERRTRRDAAISSGHLQDQGDIQWLVLFDLWRCSVVDHRRQINLDRRSRRFATITDESLATNDHRRFLLLRQPDSNWPHLRISQQSDTGSVFGGGGNDLGSLASSTTTPTINESVRQRRQRRFGSALSGKPGLAKAQRDLVTQAVRQSAAQLLKPKLVPPPDFENFLTKYRTLLENESARDILFFPTDDVTQSSQHQRRRTIVSSVSEKDTRDARSLLAQQCLRQYTCDWSLIRFNYSKYGGDYVPLAKQSPSDELGELIYEIDLLDDQNEDEDSTDFGASGDHEQRVLKEGYLYKGPDLSSDSSFVNFKAFKKRYCYLRQDVDGSYKLDFYKDKSKGASAATLSGVKATIYLDLCSDVARSPKRGKLCFELKLAPPNESSGGANASKKQSLTPQILLGAENENQLDDWVQTLQGILEKLVKAAKKARTEETTSVASSHTSEVDSGREDTLETLKAPDYAKFCRESDEDLVLVRHTSRQNPFAVYSDLEPLLDNNDQSAIGDERVKPLMEKFGIRFLIECKALTILLPVPAEGGKMASQVEPFFLTLFLFDARDGGRRISENFYTDLNPSPIKKYLPNCVSRQNSVGADGIAVVNSEGGGEFRSPGEPEIRGVPLSRLWTADRKALFAVTHPHPDVYLIARIDKVLQGPIAAGQELYLRADAKTAAKFQKAVPQLCSRLGQYRMPFAWTAKPVFQQFIGGTESAKDTVALYRQESDKFSDEDLAKWINDLKKPEKGGGKLQTLAQSSVTINVDVSVKPEQLPGCVTTSYLPISISRQLLSSPKGPTVETTPADDPDSSSFAADGPTIFEMQPFPSHDVTVADIQPHAAYQNHIYVYPLHLKYDNQRHFSKARNICCWVEFRDGDGANAAALKSLYGRFGIDGKLFVHRMGTFVSHHQTNPQWYDEIKSALPVHLHEKHHFLFTFVHVGVESTQKKRDDGKSGASPPTSESVVGYAWLPLMKNGRVSLEDDIWLQVASTLPDGYLSCESLGLGKGYSGPDVKWVDGGRPLFRVTTRLASTILTRDLNLQTFFNNCQRLKENGTLADAGCHDRTKVPDSSKLARRFTAGDAEQIAADVSTGASASSSSSASNADSSADDVALFRELTRALFSSNTKCLIEFLPTILDQLFAVLALAKSEEIALGAVRALVHVVHESCKANKKDALKAYIKYIFKSADGQSTTTVHEELAKLATIFLRPSRTEPAATAIFMKNAWFFLDVMVKSMCQRLLGSGRIQMSRTERFSAEFQYKIDTFVETLTLYLCQKYKEMPDECRAANKSLAYFLRACLSLMDRGFVFGLIYFVCHKLDAMESKTLKQFKIDFLQIICQHEHFLSLNVPVLCAKEGGGPYRKNADSCQDQFSMITAVEAAYQAGSSFATNQSASTGGTPTQAQAQGASTPVGGAGAPPRPASPQKRQPTSLFQRIFSFGVGVLNTGLANTGITNLIGDLTNGSGGSDGASDTAAMDLAHEFTLSDDYCSNHYLVGLLLRHIDYAICESRDLRKRLIAILRNLLAKHSYDDRCQGKMQTNLASLYFPLIPLLMEHLNHLELRDVISTATPTHTMVGGPALDGSRDSSTLNSYRNTLIGGDQVSPAASVAIRHSNSERSVLAGSKRQMSLWDLPSNIVGGTATSNRAMPPRQDSDGTSVSTLKAVSIPTDGERVRSESISPTPTTIAGGGEDNIVGQSYKLSVDHEYSEIDNKSIRTLTQTSVPSSSREKSPVSSMALAAGATLPQMLSQTEPFLQYSRFDDNEIKDLLICAVYVLKNVNRDALGWFWQQCDRQGLMEFLRLLDLLLYHFKYQGKQRILRLTSNKLRSSHRTVTLSSPKGSDSAKRLTSGSSASNQDCKPSKRDSTIVESPYSVLQEAHLAQEVGLVVLDCMAAFVCTQKALMSATPRSEFLEKICDMYYSMLSRQSSADLLRQVIASLKLLVKNYTAAFLDGATNLCNDLCRKLLECCNSPISLVQADACNLLYLLMRMNYEHTGKKNFSRVHQQMIISLSQLLGDGMNLNNPAFNRALSILNGFATSDKQQHRFANEVKEVVRRQRTVLMATSQLKEHSDDPDMLADLQKSLADSYAQSPRLRETWLQNLARLHVKRQHFAEAAQCFLHMAAVTAEVLKANGILPAGAEQFCGISDNVGVEESLDTNSPDDRQLLTESGDALGYDSDAFINRVIQCAELMSKADRFESMGPLYRCVTPLLEQLKDYEALTDAYATLHEAYEKASQVNRTGKRVLGTYFRVRFYGQVHFEHEHGKDFIYREPKYTPLAEFTERLQQQYGTKLGDSDLVRLISDSNPVNAASLDPKLAYIQVTHVEPYFEDQTEADASITSTTMGDYDRHTNIRRFFYDSPFTSDGRPARAASLVDQCKRRFVMDTTPKSFPYVVRRIPVAAERIRHMNPLETAIDELRTKSNELRLIMERTPVDCKRLQLRLQGAVQPTVNAGPLAYAEAFCNPAEMEKYGSGEIGRLCATYKEFLTVCWEALEINDRLITPDQFEYQQSLLRYFRDTVDRLNTIFGSQMLQISNSPLQQTDSTGGASEQKRTNTERRHSGKRSSAVFLLSTTNGGGS